MGLRKAGIAVAAMIAALVVLAAGIVWLSSAYETPLTKHLPAELKPRVYPAVDMTGLDPARVRILENVRREFDANRPGTYFSEGVEEPWCADFVSTVLRDSDLALHNPNSGTWRIPGVYTLTEYFQREGRLRPADHRPTPGDVVLYAPEHPAMRQHTNFVVAVSGDEVTTVGGNQEGGISAWHYRLPETFGIVGYGIPVR
ncbi:cysteine, histidine-dependent amidohydrolase/peptidase [Tsukamurella pulmonis]|uniref:CHAP domain-containing protein n=1 Tax=Tsukamurella pulmonis TaxID=47312 RepID=UPI00079CC93D|nr:CHAP domain-containing protein [Tsukamurella pulmonis]KXP13125.1 cysteine, histidine-dependent amidohydrolase/peptidase [Tsukamurella pulmonis]RDH11944.1 CHAP domain-containing protein [Tsukamurella pulmonis]